MSEVTSQSNNAIQPFSIKLGDVVIDHVYLYNLTCELNELNKTFKGYTKSININRLVKTVETISRAQGYIDLIRACGNIIYPMYDNRFNDDLSRSVLCTASALLLEVQDAKRNVEDIVKTTIDDYKPLSDIGIVIEDETYAIYRECCDNFNENKWINAGNHICITLHNLNRLIERYNGIDTLRKTAFVEYNDYAEFMMVYDQAIELRSKLHTLSDTYTCMDKLFNQLHQS